MFFTMLGRSALSYLASKISTTHLVALRVLVGSWAKLKLSLSALEMLGLICRLLIFLMGRKTSSMVMDFSLKSNTDLGRMANLRLVDKQSKELVELKLQVLA